MIDPRATAILIAFAITACPGDPTVPPDGGQPPERTWEISQDNIAGAVISIWASSSTDVWIAGADPNDGNGPVAGHFDGTKWTTLATGATGDLWWVLGVGADDVWFAGENGLVLRYSRANKTFTTIPPVTTATLFGVWAAPAGPLYAVGGDIFGAGANGVVLRIEADTATVTADLPTGLDPAETLFKVWGSAANDVWVIGDRGSVLRYDGTSWGRSVQVGNPRLVTIHGGSANDMVIVGGLSQAVLLERKSGQAWTDVSPDGLSALSGVFVAPDGVAVAVGSQGTLIERRRGFWADIPTPPLNRDWHAAWIDEAGEYWVVGGYLRSADALTDGAVLRLRGHAQ